MLVIIEKPNFKKVVDVFNYLDSTLDNNFSRVFPIILTDRDPSFSDYEGIETDALTGEIRTNVFYCDSFKSNQKASVENMNKQLRKYFLPKGKRIDHYTQKEITEINMFMNNQKLHSLSGFSGNDASIKIYGKNTLDNLYEALMYYFEIIK